MSLRRGGFTLVEIVVALAVIALLGAMVSSTMSSQQRLFRATTEQLEVRGSVRDVLTVLAEELRGSSLRDTVRLMSDSAIELFSALGSSAVCGSPSSKEVALVPAAVTDVSPTSWLAVPDTGDLALIYGAASSTPGVWERYRIVATTPRSLAVCTSTTLAGATPSPSTFVLTLSPAANSPAAGSPIRFIRRGRYSLYKSSDGHWYLGYRRCNAIGPSVCAAIQPIAGYYQAYSTDTARTGIFFRYLDGTGQPLSRTSNPLELRRVQISAHATSGVPVTIDGRARPASDSAYASAALRNSP